jgi:hypothetical protein
MSRAVCVTAWILFVLISQPAWAQPQTERFERQLEQIREQFRLRVNEDVPVGQRVFFDYGAFTVISYVSADDSDNNNRSLFETDFVGFGRLNVDGVHDFFVRGRGFYQDFSKGDAPDNQGDGWDGRLERLFYRFDLARSFQAYRGTDPAGNFKVQVGRDLAFWGNGLVLVQELDGGTIDLSYGRLTLQLLGGVTPEDSVDFDSSRPDFDDDTRRGFYGAMLTTPIGTHRPYAYVLWQRDYNDKDEFTFSPDGGATTITTDYDYDSYYIGLGATGALGDRFVYGIEAVYEGGNTLSNSFGTGALGQIEQVPQTRDDIEAWAVSAQLNYLPGDVRNTRFLIEALVASGDDDRQSTSTTLAGNAPGTRDNAFNAFGLINTGVAFAPPTSNLMMLRAGASTFPCPDARVFRRLQIGTDLFVFGKTDADAPIDEPTSDDRYLGFESDVYVNWQLTSDVALGVRYGAFFPGSAIDNDKVRQFVYAGVTFAF